VAAGLARADPVTRLDGAANDGMCSSKLRLCGCIGQIKRGGRGWFRDINALGVRKTMLFGKSSSGGKPAPKVLSPSLLHSEWSG